MHRFLPLFATLVLTACGNKTQNQDAEMQEIFDKTVPNVTVEVAQISDFNSQLLCNGRIVAADYADVFWQSSAEITDIKIHNGAYVNQGDVLAVANDSKVKSNLESAKIDLDVAQLSMLDLVVGQGYTIDNVPENVLKTAQVKSGYAKAKINLEQCEREVENAKLTAPCSGLVANVESSGKGMNNTSKPFCRIINTQQMKVSFKVMESELNSVAIGNKVQVKPYALPSTTFAGTVVEVNPVVEDNSLVKVTAVIDNPQSLYDGMNTQISVENNVGKYVTVKKSAIVKRSNRDVVFVAKDGKAWWHYVTVGSENFDRAVILEGIEVGDSVIISENINLADRSEIIVK